MFCFINLSYSCELNEFLGHISGECVIKLPSSTLLLNLAVTNDAHAAGLMKCLQERAQEHYWVGLGE